MSYVSPVYLLVFLPIVFLMYQLFPKKYRWVSLLIASYIFYYTFSKKIIAYIIVTTILVYLIGELINFINKPKDDSIDKRIVLIRKKRIVTVAVIALVGTLATLKYAGFFGKNFNVLMSLFTVSYRTPIMKFMVPLGISFYTLQAISYLVDVYRGTIEVEHNVGKLGLYLAFFPTVMQGPIGRYGELSKTLFNGDSISLYSLSHGAQRISWGIFKKLVIADRLNELVQVILDGNPNRYSGSIILLGAIIYSIQLYMDFSGIVDVSLGTAEVLNIKLPENFRQPFFAKNVNEFWRRWHITLGTWFKDYLFYPVMLSRPIKKLTKKTRKKFGKRFSLILTNSIALFAVWLANGLWHGTGWNYIAFGMYYFGLNVLSLIVEPTMTRIKTKLNMDSHKGFLYGMQIFKMSMIIVLGELIFRVTSMRRILIMFKHIIFNFNISDLGTNLLKRFRFSGWDAAIVVIAILIVFIVDVLKERDISIRTHFKSYPLFVRWGLSYAAILAIIIFGAYGRGYIPVEAIYAGF